MIGLKHDKIDFSKQHYQFKAKRIFYIVILNCEIGECKKFLSFSKQQRCLLHKLLNLSSNKTKYYYLYAYDDNKSIK